MGQGQLEALGPKLSHCKFFLLVAMSQVSRAALGVDHYKLLLWQVMPWSTSCWSSLCVCFVWASKSVFY